MEPDSGVTSTSGRIVYDGQDLATLSARTLLAIRAKIYSTAEG
jgi:ABC-type cobalamin transport system ATPase subunit